MRRLEGGHVAIQSTLMLKIRRKALDRHVGDREQMEKRMPWLCTRNSFCSPKEACGGGSAGPNGLNTRSSSSDEPGWA